MPRGLLGHVVRGPLDGDGSIIDKVWRADTSRRQDYFSDWFRGYFYSASRDHIEWLHASRRAELCLRGWVGMRTLPGRNPAHRLAFGKHDSIRLLSWLYADRDAPCLLRKRAIWDDYASRHQDLLPVPSLKS